MLRAMLNAHSQLVVPPECGYIQWLGEKFAGGPLSVDVFVDELMKCRKIEGWELDFIQLRAHLEQQLGQGLIEFNSLVDSTHRYYGRNKEIRCWGDKNNYYIQNPQAILNLVDFRIIHLVRDPRGCYSSVRQLSQGYQSAYAPKVSSSIRGFCQSWSKDNEQVESLSSSANYVRVRYEDLLNDPEGSLKFLFDWIGVRYEPTGATFHHHVDEPEITMEWKKKLNEPIDQDRVHAWQRELDADECATIWGQTSPYISKCGYVE